MREEDFLPYDGGKEGLYHRFYQAVRTSCSPEELLETAKTKRYPTSRLRRMLLSACWMSRPRRAASPISVCWPPMDGAGIFCGRCSGGVYRY